MSFFRKKQLFVLLLGIILLVVLIGYSLSDREKLTAPEQFVMDSVGWVQSVFSKPVNGFVNLFTNISDIKNTYNENQILKEKLSEYKNLAIEVQELKKENKELRKAIDMTASTKDFEPIQATVISRSPERWSEQITINRGSQHGVKKNMAVVTVDGMIGKVENVSKLTSNVQLLTGFDKFNRISAKVPRKKGKNIFGLIEEFDKESGSLKLRIIEESKKDLKEGEVVVSSSMGGLFPSDLPIGTVKEVIPDQYGLTRIALVEPAANMYEINHVIVVDRTLPVDDGSVVDGEEEEEE